jgi:hypothetical protein
MKAVGSSIAEFHHDGAAHKAELSWGHARMGHAYGLTFPYRLFFDGGKIAVSDVRVENPASAFIPLLIFAVPVLLPLVESFF